MSDKMNNELSMEELESVSGGRIIVGETKRNVGAGVRDNIMPIFCSCGYINNVDISKNSFKCSKCGKVQAISG